jgi:hypothetical protein
MCLRWCSSAWSVGNVWTGEVNQLSAKRSFVCLGVILRSERFTLFIIWDGATAVGGAGLCQPIGVFSITTALGPGMQECQCNLNQICECFDAVS